MSNKCLSCHAPLAMHEERSMAEDRRSRWPCLDTSVLASDGVSCLACHMQSPERNGNSLQR
jgi:hypothetical protein